MSCETAYARPARGRARVLDAVLDCAGPPRPAPGRFYRRLTARVLAFGPEQAIITPVTLRRLLVMLVSAVLLVGALAAPASARLGGDTAESSLVSKGRGTQTFEGGGLIYGTVARNATIYVVNLSGLNDLNITIKAKGVRYDGGRLYTTHDVKGMAFKVSGSNFQVVIKGISALNGLGVYGKATFRGFGSYSLSGGPYIPWGRGKVNLGSPPIATVN